jgi:hypothetical protein
MEWNLVPLHHKIPKQWNINFLPFRSFSLYYIPFCFIVYHQSKHSLRNTCGFFFKKFLRNTCGFHENFKSAENDSLVQNLQEHFITYSTQLESRLSSFLTLSSIFATIKDGFRNIKMVCLICATLHMLR